MKRIWHLLRYMRPYVAYLSAAVLLMLVFAAMAGFQVMLIKPIMDNVLSPSGNSSALHVLTFSVPQFHHTLDLQRLLPFQFSNAWAVVAVALISSAVVKSVCDYAGTLLANKAGFGMITDIRNELYDAILWRSTAFFQKHSTGTLISTLINDVERVQSAMATVLIDLFQQFFTLLIMVGVVIYLGGKMAWILLLFVPVTISSARRIGRSVRRTTRTGQDKLAEIQNIVQETIVGNGIVKAFGMERWEMNRFRRAAERLLAANMRSVAAQAISSPLMDLFGRVGIALLLLFGQRRIVHGHWTIGQFTAFLASVILLYDPVRKMPVYYNSFQQAVGASDEIFRFIEERDDVRERKNAVKLKAFERDIEFKDVSFAYNDDGRTKDVLNGISLNIKHGEVVALVGPSGAGKSTLMNLLPRFFDVTGGAILIDGHDVRDLTLTSLRKQIGKVTQETVLFNDTVRNNIAYGQPDVAMERIEAAAKAALAHDFIMRMPDGYNTDIGERGTRLSGGERQRLAIARAIFKDAPLLILDEATSSLDTESEAAVQAALANLMQGRTTLVIAHRLSTVRSADRIAVLEQGSLTELGTHEELLALGGTYSRLYKLQFGEESTDSESIDPQLAGIEGVA